MNVSRQFKFGERFRLRPSVEIGNVFNMTVYSYGSSFIDFGALIDPNTITNLNDRAAQVLRNQTIRESFLVPQRAFRPLQIRVGVRFDF